MDCKENLKDFVFLVKTHSEKKKDQTTIYLNSAEYKHYRKFFGEGVKIVKLKPLKYKKQITKSK